MKKVLMGLILLFFIASFTQCTVEEPQPNHEIIDLKNTVNQNDPSDPPSDPDSPDDPGDPGDPD